MSRNADVRHYLSQLFPLIQTSEVISKLEDLLSKTRADQKEIDPTGCLKPLLVADVKRALNEFESINLFTENSQLADIPGIFNQIMSLTSDSSTNTKYLDKGPIGALGGYTHVARLNGRIYTAIMKRCYNWTRSGFDNPIAIKHVVNSRVLAVADISDISFEDGYPCFHLNISKNNKTLINHRVKLPVYFAEYDKEGIEEPVLVVTHEVIEKTPAPVGLLRRWLTYITG